MTDKLTIEIAGQEFDILKRGVEQAEQVLALTNWFTTYGPQLADGLSELSEDANTFQYIGAMAKNLRPEALLDLYALIIGCDHAFAAENFDIADLIDAGFMVYENHPSIQRVVNRFLPGFGTNESTDGSSTESE